MKKSTLLSLPGAVLLAWSFLTPHGAALRAAAFTAGDLVVTRVGAAGSGGALSSAATAVFLDEFTLAGGSVQTLALPTAASGANARFTLAGTATTEGALNLSADGRFLALAGYDAAPGTAGVAATTAASTNRVAARVDAAGAADTSTRLTDAFSGGSVRSAATGDGTRFWLGGTSSSAGSGGVRFTPFGNAGASTQVSATPNNARTISIFGGQLYVSSGSGANIGVNSVGAGLPTAGGQTATLIAPAGNAYAYAFLDRDPAVSGVDTLYVADNTAGVLKFSFDGSAWTARGGASVGSAAPIGLTAVVNGAGVDLYVTTSASLLKLTDAAAFNANFSANPAVATLAAAPANTAFRGVAFAPASADAANAPTGAGAAMPNTLAVGESTLLSVAVTPGANPPRTGLSVTVNLSAIGGSSAQPFFDDGSNGDAQAGDHVFSFRATVATGSGPVSLPATIRDAQNRAGAAAIALTVSSPPPITLIHAIQGQTETPQTGMFRVEGIVTAVFPGLSPAGFYVQEEDADADGDPLTSEGIFVVSATFPQVGQKVQVQGTVANPNGLTQFTAGARFNVQAGGATFPLPAAVTPVLPFPVTGGGTAYLERFEGMRVVFPGALFATDTYNLGRFGEVSLSVNDRLFIPTNTVDPNDAPASGVSVAGAGNVPEVTANEDLNQRSRFILDDGRDGRPATVPYLRAGGPGGGRTLRLGDSTRGLEGILTFGFGNYRLQPTAPVTFDATNPRPAAPAPVGGNVTVAESNVLNYFNTFGGANDRGADSSAELDRQRAKLVAVLSGLDADIVGLTEMENNGSGPGSALDDLVNNPILGLNAAQAAAGKAVYAILPPPADPFGSDAIKVAFIYKASRVTPVGPSLTDNANFSVYNRPPLAQLFSVNATGGAFYVTINHFKSKGGSGATGPDADQGDGQSLFNDRRRQQAAALVSFLRGLAVNDPDILVIGDLNAYGEEDPIDVFRAAGYVDLIGTRTDGAQPYSFSFNGELGRLDHALGTPSLNVQVTGATEWHVNADEPRVIDYNLDTDDTTNPPPKPDDEFVANAFRASDHDPLIVGLLIGGSPLTLAPDSGRPGNAVVISGPNVGNASAVRFAPEVPATFTRDSDSQLTVTVPDGAATGPIQVVLGDGTVASPVFRLLPRITGFSPASGPVGGQVTINGSGFNGVSAVKFSNDRPAGFQRVSDTQIIATVPAGATRGALRVESPGGAAASTTKFTVTP